jgi:hypothetical protein
LKVKSQDTGKKEGKRVRRVIIESDLSSNEDESQVENDAPELIDETLAEIKMNSKKVHGLQTISNASLFLFSPGYVLLVRRNFRRLLQMFKVL